MKLTCPVCKADNAAGPICRRCRADLSLLAAVEARREYHIQLAQRAIQQQFFDEAIEELDTAAQFRDGADLKRLRACTFLLSGDFPSAFSAR